MSGRGQRMPIAVKDAVQSWIPRNLDNINHVAFEYEVENVSSWPIGSLIELQLGR
jgi:hypothetical protein